MTRRNAVSPPPRPSWAAGRVDDRSYPDACYSSKKVGPRDFRIQLMDGWNYRDGVGWVQDAPTLVMHDSGDLTLAQAAKLRDALTELLEAAGIKGAS